ncbi:rhodanese-like/PpiC domain-containing protein 12, chloroplastic [Macadamia integrifolia]|uniref:rhodanese-like/PpiC domain-containing protein 12, chloroplastic n=1 Tax=Macadamia integrifolia TaxID=60698 RepID=UPI001C4F26E5|nr:rhodanese-like/PpiC domain-containing protein 12, chloroplastic [Macadamia integrifolia]
MLRASHLPSLTSPTLCTLRFSMFSSLCVSSSLKPHKFSSLTLLLTFLPKTFTHPSPSLHSQSFGWTSPMVGSARMNGIASFSTGNNVREGGGGGGSREILVQHLLVSEDNLKLLLEVQQKISGGVDLGDLAVEYSICPSKEQGGMLGWVQKGQMVPEFEEAAFNAPLNKVVRCKTKFGWHLLQVLSEREAALLQDIEPEEFYAKMQDPCFLEEAQLIDVREPEEVAQASLPGFQVLPLRQFGKWGPEITTKFDTEKDTYVLCHHGMRSLQVAKWLQTQGFKKIFNVSGGIHAYAVKVDASIPTY